MRGIIFIMCSLIGVFAFGQSEVQFQNNALKKVLQKNGIPDFTKVSEINVTEKLKQQYRLQGKFFEIESEAGRYKYIYTGRVNSCRAGGCSISAEVPKEGDFEYFDYFILFDKDKKVQLVKVFNYQATHGQEIAAKGWLKQFIGYDGSKSLQVNKDIDSISGATVSVYAITIDVETKIEILHKIKA